MISTGAGLAAGLRRRTAAARAHLMGAHLMVASLVLAVMTVVDAGPAAAAAMPLTDCTATAGAIMAVDFSHWAGPLLRSCASTPTTG